MGDPIGFIPFEEKFNSPPPQGRWEIQSGLSRLNKNLIHHHHKVDGRSNRVYLFIPKKSFTVL